MSKKSQWYVCTACDQGRGSTTKGTEYVNPHRAESSHPELRVPLCGECFYRCRNVEINNGDVCLWCGIGDDARFMFECDTCRASVCKLCIERNFPAGECKRIEDADPWSCYKCLPTPELVLIQIPPEKFIFNMMTVYDVLHEKSKSSNTVGPSASDNGLSALIAKMSHGEQLLASIFCPGITHSQLHDMQIYSQYLAARDVYGSLLCVSKVLNEFFKEYLSHFYFVPGLFMTEQDIESNLQLYPHQLRSIRRMIKFEQKGRRAGLLRGGILGDAPGLGKTVTMLAFCLSSAHQLPSAPNLSSIINIDNINEQWKLQYFSGNLQSLINPIVVALMKILGQAPSLKQILNNLMNPSTRKSLNPDLLTYKTVIEFEREVHRTIRAETVNNYTLRSIAQQTFQQNMLAIKTQLDKSSRRRFQSLVGKRIQWELSLRPSSATLIIVPLALLEHWYEQIIRHIELKYLSPSGDGRGVVYIDGLGDILDVIAPLPKLQVVGGMNSTADVLSEYIFVITTFERCTAVQAARVARCDDDTDGTSMPPVRMRTSSVLDKMIQVFLGIRWQRIVVDEGHDLTDNTRHLATTLISEIAAEKRWVMSGTPTTGNQSVVALEQLHRIFAFLRHAIFGVDGKVGYERWHDTVMKPFLSSDPAAFEYIISILNSVLIRHTKVRYDSIITCYLLTILYG